MREVEILKLIDKAKEYSLNSFVPHTGIAVGSCVLTEDNMVFGGCSVETFTPSASLGAAGVAVIKAISEGYIEVKVLCIYSDGNSLPTFSGMDRDFVFQFGPDAEVILACDDRYETYKMYELLPFSKREE